MPLNTAAALAAATARVDALISQYPEQLGSLTAEQRTTCINAMRDELVVIFNAIVANAEVLPSGSPVMAAGGDNVTGKGRIA